MWRKRITKQQSLWSFVFLIYMMLQHLKSLSTSPRVCKHCRHQGYSALDRRKAAALHVWLNTFIWLHMFMSSAGRNAQSCNVCFSGRLCLCEWGPQGHWVRVQLCKSVICPVAGAVCQLLPASPDLQVWRPSLPLLWRCVAKKIGIIMDRPCLKIRLPFPAAQLLPHQQHQPSGLGSLHDAFVLGYWSDKHVWTTCWGKRY